MGESYSNLLVHIIFSTKNRTAAICEEWEAELHAYLGGAVGRAGGVSVAVGGCRDHVHLLVRVSQVMNVADLVKFVKAGSSGWVHRKFPDARKFAWQRGYAAFSVSESNAGKVRAYIANQKEHHRRMTFQEEFRKFLENHGIEFDERYLFTDR